MRFLGTGSALPKTVLTNAMLSEMVDTSDEWIRTRTGIQERRIVKEESIGFLAFEAAKQACEQARKTSSFSYEDISMLICATASNKDRCPPLACCLQRDLGLRENILAFDLNGACTGFIFALIVAKQFLQKGEHVLLVGSETLSHFVDYTDRSTCVLFGDGAGAALITADEDELARDFFWVSEVQGNPDILSITDTLRMDGQGVFKFAVEALVRNIKQVVIEAAFSLDDIDLFICHQANERIIKSAAKRLGIPQERFFMNLAKYGNTSAASIPLALDEAVRSGVLKEESKIVLAGFGGGLTAGAVCFTWTQAGDVPTNGALEQKRIKPMKGERSAAQ